MKKLFILFVSILCITSISHATELTVAVGSSLAPYIIQPDNSGIELDILKEVLPNYKLKIKYLPFARINKSYYSDKINLVLPINELSGLPAYYSDSHISYKNSAITLMSDKIFIHSITALKQY